MRHVPFVNSQQIFKAFALSLMVMIFLITVIPMRGTVQASPVKDVPQVEIPELETVSIEAFEQGLSNVGVPDQSTPVFERARKAVNQMMTAYIFGDWVAFEDQFSQDFPERTVFLFKAQTGKMQKIPNDFQFFINTVNETKEVLSVSFSWLKKHMNWDDVNDTKAEGKCEFVFQKTSKGVLLKNVIGNNPF